MGPRQALKLGLSILRRPWSTTRLVLSQFNAKSGPLRDSIGASADWLIKAQVRSPSDGGYSRSFSLWGGWDRSYIETTGYIIPTMIDVGKYLNQTRYRESALSAGHWLLSVQTKEGAFTDIDRYEPHVFDTGQVLLGLNSLFRETNDSRFLTGAVKAGRWLAKVQDENGAWTAHAYNGQPHAYYSRVAGALIETGMLAQDQDLVRCGEQNLEWVSKQEQSNGYFLHSEFRFGEDALLHTIVYVLEGFWLAFVQHRSERWLEIATRGVYTLLAKLNREGLLFSQYDPTWRVTNPEYCITGLAQFAGLCLDLYGINGDHVLMARGSSIVKYLQSKQIQGGQDIGGGLPSSVPAWGYYGCMDLYNWNAKFFLDAALRLAVLQEREVPRAS